MKKSPAIKVLASMGAFYFIFAQLLPQGFAATQPVSAVTTQDIATQPETDALAPSSADPTTTESSNSQTSTTIDFLEGGNALSLPATSAQPASKASAVTTPTVTTPPSTVSDNPYLILSGTKASGQSIWISSNGGKTYTRLVTNTTSTGWSATVTLSSGANNFKIIAKDSSLNPSAAVTIPTVTYTVTAPAVTTPPSSTSTKTVTLSGTKASGESIWISSNGGKTYTRLVTGTASTTWSAAVSLNTGANNFKIVGADTVLNLSAVVTVPTITYGYTVTAPTVTAPATTVSTNTITLSGTKTSGQSIWISSDSGKTYTQLVTSSTSTTWSASVSLQSGANNFKIIAKDSSSNQSSAVTVPTITYTVPVPTVTAPATTVSTNSITLSGTKASGESIWISSNGGTSYTQLVSSSTSTAWSASVSLVNGVNNFMILAKDSASNQSAAVTVPTITCTYVATTPTPETQVTGSLQGTKLTVTGTNNTDDILISTNTAGAIVLTSDAGSTTFTGSVTEIVVYGFAGSDTIDVAPGVSVPVTVNTGDGDNQVFLRNSAKNTVNAGAGNDLLVSLNSTEDILNGGTGIDSYWCDISDILNNLSSDETGYQTVHRISQFYQPYTTDSTSSYYIPLTLSGQNLADPTGSGTKVNVSSYSLFNNDTVSYNDIEQGNLGDCYFLAGLASLAAEQTQVILQSIAPLGDGTYAVRFYKNGAANYLRIDGDIFMTGGIPTYAGFGVGNSIWTMLLEKAFAFFRTPGKNSYSSLTAGYLYEPFTALTGLSYTNTFTSSYGSTISDSQLYSTLKAELDAGDAVTLGSNSSQPSGSMVVGGHAYALLSVTTVNGVMYANVYNPWGVVNSTTVSYGGNPAGVLTLTMSQLQKYFAYACASSVVGPARSTSTSSSKQSLNVKALPYMSSSLAYYYRIFGQDLWKNKNTLGYPYWLYTGAYDPFLS